jgi:hypothetical protein
MVRRRLVATVVALLALALSTAVAGQAHAGDEGPWPWPVACAEAAFTSSHTDEVTNTLITLSGWGQPGPGAKPPVDARYALAFYDRVDPVRDKPYGYVRGTKPLPPEGTREEFSVTLGGPDGPDWAYTGAVCLVSGIGPDDRLACVAIDMGMFRPTARPVPTDYAIVKTPIDTVVRNGTSPFCGSCAKP